MYDGLLFAAGLNQMTRKDLPSVHLGDSVRIVVGVWFPAKYPIIEVLAALKPLGGILVAIESNNDAQKNKKVEVGSPLGVWTQSPSAKERLEVSAMTPWIPLETVDENPPKLLYVREATVLFKSR